MDRQELLRRAKNTIIDADEEEAVDIIQEARETGVDLVELLMFGFSKGNDEVGEQFDKGLISLPELIYATGVMGSVTDMILDFLDEEHRKRLTPQSRGTVVLATVAGDIHDIGKGIVASVLRAAGFQVIDLGCEVPVSVILEEARKHDADIIGTSALLTSTLSEQRKLEKTLLETGEKERFHTMVGGAPCTPRWARKIGADGYSENAVEAAKVAQELMKEKTERP